MAGQPRQVVDVPGHLEDNVAALPPVAPIGPAPGDVGLAPERRRAVPASPTSSDDDRLVDELRHVGEYRFGEPGSRDRVARSTRQP
jgi:hypothetical protein